MHTTEENQDGFLHLLRATPVGKILRSTHVPQLLQVQHSVYGQGCTGCHYETGGGARYCPFKTACMSHYRPDRQSTVFTLPETENQNPFNT